MCHTSHFKPSALHISHPIICICILHFVFVFRILSTIRCVISHTSNPACTSITPSFVFAFCIFYFVFCIVLYILYFVFRILSTIRCVMRHTSNPARTSITGSFAHIHPLAPSSSCVFLASDVIPIRHQSGIAEGAYRGSCVSHIKDDTSRGTKDRAALLPMWQQEWHLYLYCPLQFVINHASIHKSIFLHLSPG